MVAPLFLQTCSHSAVVRLSGELILHGSEWPSHVDGGIVLAHATYSKHFDLNSRIALHVLIPLAEEGYSASFGGTVPVILQEQLIE